MRFAKIGNDDHVKAFKNAVGAVCPICDNPVIAKCGHVYVHHWAHVAGAECDTWYEPLTEWHANWEDIVRDEFCEYIMKPHRADILGNDRCVIELQSTSIDPNVIKERELFYNNMIWLWNGEKIVKNFNTSPTSNCYTTIEGQFISWSEFYQKYLSNVINSEYSETIAPKFIKVNSTDVIQNENTTIVYNWCYANKRMMYINKPLYIHFPDGRLFKVIKIRGPYDPIRDKISINKPDRVILNYDGPLVLDNLTPSDKEKILSIEKSVEQYRQRSRRRQYY